MPQVVDQNKAEIARRSRSGDNPKARAQAAADRFAAKLDAAGWRVRKHSRKRATVYVRQALALALRREGHSLRNIAVAIGVINTATTFHSVREANACPRRRKLAMLIAIATPEAIREEIASWGNFWCHSEAVALVQRGFSFGRAAATLGLTRGQVAGAVHRARGTQEAAS